MFLVQGRYGNVLRGFPIEEDAKTFAEGIGNDVVIKHVGESFLEDFPHGKFPFIYHRSLESDYYFDREETSCYFPGTTSHPGNSNTFEEMILRHGELMMCSTHGDMADGTFEVHDRNYYRVIHAENRTKALEDGNIRFFGLLKLGKLDDLPHMRSHWTDEENYEYLDFPEWQDYVDMLIGYAATSEDDDSEEDSFSLYLVSPKGRHDDQRRMPSLYRFFSGNSTKVRGVKVTGRCYQELHEKARDALFPHREGKKV